MKIMLIAPEAEDAENLELEEMDDYLPMLATATWAQQACTILNHSKHEVDLFLGAKNTEKIISALEEEMDKPGLFVFFYHGDTDHLINADGSILLDINDLPLLKNKFIFAIACRSAAQFGHEAVRMGAVGFIGLNHDFTILQECWNDQGACLLEGLTSLAIDGETAADARHKIVKRSNMELSTHLKTLGPIAQLTIIPTLIHNRDALVHLGCPDWRME